MWLLSKARTPLVTATILWLAGCYSLAADQIGISPSGHYFLHNGRTRIFLGNSGTQVVMQNLNIDYPAWVDAAATEGHHTLHIWAFIAPRQKLDGSDLESRYGYVYPGVTPWARKSSGPLAFDQGKQWDLFTFDEGSDPQQRYWPRLRDLAARLRQKGMNLGITVFFGWPKDSRDFDYHPFNVINGGPAQTREDITHIQSPGTEVHTEPWSDQWPVRKKTQWLWEKLCLKLINEMAVSGNVWFDFRDEWSYDNDTNAEDHFRNFFMSRGAVWADRSFDASFRVTNPSVPPFGSTPAMKTEGGPYGHDDVRREVWSRAMSGIHYLLHNDSRSPGIMAWDPLTAAIKGIDPDDDLGRKYVGYASYFFNQLVAVFDTLLPHDDLVSGSSRCLAAPGDEYTVYVPAGESSVTVDLSALSGQGFALFFDVRTGALGSSFPLAGGAPRVIATPSSTQDWALLIQRQGLAISEIFTDGFESGDTSVWSAVSSEN